MNFCNVKKFLVAFGFMSVFDVDCADVNSTIRRRLHEDVVASHRRLGKDNLLSMLSGGFEEFNEMKINSCGRTNQIDVDSLKSELQLYVTNNQHPFNSVMIVNGNECSIADIERDIEILRGFKRHVCGFGGAQALVNRMTLKTGKNWSNVSHPRELKPKAEDRVDELNIVLTNLEAIDSFYEGWIFGALSAIDLISEKDSVESRKDQPQNNPL